MGPDLFLHRGAGAPLNEGVIMQTIWWALVALAILAVAYAIARPWIIARSPRWEAFCAWIDPLAGKLWRNSRQILISRLYWVGGALVGLHDTIAHSQFMGLDWTPITSRLIEPVPPDFRPLAISAAVAGTGVIFEALRKATTGPVQGK